MRKNSLGSAHLLLIVGVVALAIVAVVAIVVVLGSKQSGPEDIATQNTITPTQILQKDEELPISDSDKTTDVEKELDTTDIGDIEEDLNSLDLESIPL